MFDRYSKIQQEQAEGNEEGFTLIELLIVIVVLGILAAVTVFALSGVTGTSLTAACNADAKSVSVAQEAFRAQSASTYAGATTTTGGVTQLVAAGYLRSAPGNTGKYKIDTGSNGLVQVTNVKTTVVQLDYDNNPGICNGL